MQHPTSSDAADAADPRRELETARKALGLTQRDVAERIGKSVDTYRRRISGELDFTGTEIGILRRVVGRDVADALIP